MQGWEVSGGFAGGTCEDGTVSETGSPGRYSRSFNGLIGALIVTVLGVVAVVAFRSFFTDSEPYTPTPVAYLETVAQVQDGGVQVVYPRSLPEGWTATDVDFRAGAAPEFGISALTEDEHARPRLFFEARTPQLGRGGDHHQPVLGVEGLAVAGCA